MSERDQSPEIRKLSQDLAQGLAGLKFITNNNSARLDKLERVDVQGKVGVLEVHVETIRTTVNKTENANFSERLAVLETQVAGLIEVKKDHTGKIATMQVNEARELAGVEKTKAKWGLYAAIGTGLLSGVVSILIQIIKWIGGTP